MSLFSGDELACALRGVPFPARRHLLAAWADTYCASSEVREGLHHLPDREYRTWRDLITTLDSIERRARAILKSEADVLAGSSASELTDPDEQRTRGLETCPRSDRKPSSQPPLYSRNR
jgi:hypothetical protein